MMHRRVARPATRSVLPLVIAIVAVVLRIVPDFQAGGLLALRQHDEGVHYLAGLALIHGQLPYRDFVFLQPPGAALLMAPFAAAGHWVGQEVALGMARTLIALIEGLTTWLLVRSLLAVSLLGAILAGCLYAVAPDAVMAGRMVLLEPIINLACMLGVYAFLKGRLRLAGVALGAGIAVKLFAFAYPLALVTLLIASRRWRDLQRLGVWMGLTLLVLLGPFVVLAPGSFWRDVVTLQTTRPLDGVQGAWLRLQHILEISTAGTRAHTTVTVLAVVVLVVLLAMTGWRFAPTRVWALGLVILTIGFLSAPTFYDHYGAFAALPLCAVVGMTPSLFAGRPARTVLPAVGVVAAVWLAWAVVTVGKTTNHDSPALLTDRLTTPAQCAFTDAPNLLVAANRARDSSSTCPAWVDPEGTALSHVTTTKQPDFYPDGFRHVVAWQDAARTSLHAAHYALIRDRLPISPDLDRANQSYIRRHFAVKGQGQTWQLWVRIPANSPR
jgi:hypothetical protein